MRASCIERPLLSTYSIEFTFLFSVHFIERTLKLSDFPKHFLTLSYLSVAATSSLTIGVVFTTFQINPLGLSFGVSACGSTLFVPP